MMPGTRATAYHLTKLYASNQTRADGNRRLWGRRPPAPGRPDTRMHIPLAGDVAGTSAALLFSEPPTFTVPDTSTQARLDELAEAGGIANRLFEAAEVSAALGGVYLRVTWDAQLAARPLLTVVHADAALPEFQFGLLRAVTFWHELPSDTATIWRHLERHEPGVITHGLYQGDRDRLGAPRLTVWAQRLSGPDSRPVRRARHHMVKLDARYQTRSCPPDRAHWLSAKQRPRGGGELRP
jgi:hypothetical protein